MSTLYTLLEQARAARVKLEQEQAIQISHYAGAKELFIARFERRIAAHQEAGDELGLSQFLAHVDQAVKKVSEG